MNPSDSTDLGPVLYEERRHITPAVTYTGLGLIFLVTGVLCSFTESRPPEPPHAYLIMGSVVAAGGLLCLVIGLVRLIPNLGASWHLHARGVRVVQRSGERSLRYELVDELTHKIWRVFFHGVCTGEVHDVTFRSTGPEPQTIQIKQVRRPSTASGRDLDRPGELQLVCDKVAGLIAVRMLGKLEEGEPVPWAGDLRLSAGGLGIGPSSEPIPWDQIERYEIEEGTLRLWRRGDPQPAVSVRTELPNFFPGYRLLQEKTGLGF